MCPISWYIVVSEVECEDARVLSMVKAVFAVGKLSVILTFIVIRMVANHFGREITIIAELIAVNSDKSTVYVEECAQLADECILTDSIAFNRELRLIYLAIEFKQRAKVRQFRLGDNLVVLIVREFILSQRCHEMLVLLLQLVGKRVQDLFNSNNWRM